MSRMVYMDRGQGAGARSAVNTPLLPAPAAPAALAAPAVISLALT